MSSRAPVKSAFDNLRPTILRQPTRSEITPEAEARLLQTSDEKESALDSRSSSRQPPSLPTVGVPDSSVSPRPLLQSKKREPLLLVSFRIPQSLKQKLEAAAKLHEVNQTDLINEGIQLNLQRYV